MNGSQTIFSAQNNAAQQLHHPSRMYPLVPAHAIYYPAMPVMALGVSELSAAGRLLATRELLARPAAYGVLGPAPWIITAGGHQGEPET